MLEALVVVVLLLGFFSPFIIANSLSWAERTLAVSVSLSLASLSLLRASVALNLRQRSLSGCSTLFHHVRLKDLLFKASFGHLLEGFFFVSLLLGVLQPTLNHMGQLGDLHQKTKLK